MYGSQEELLHLLAYTLLPEYVYCQICDTARSYYAGTQRNALRDSAAGLTMLYGDHLGSASVVCSYETLSLNNRLQLRQF